VSSAARRASRRGIGPSARAATVVLLLSLLSACSSLSSDGQPAAHDGPLRVATSFYPLQWMAQRVGGDLVTVTNLTKPGAEPHDLELTPRDVASLSDADVVAYLSGFQPAVDDALRTTGATRFDAAPAADLNLVFTPNLGDPSPGERLEAKADATGRTDPHFWLDPTRLADVAQAFADTLAEQDPEHAARYRANATALTAELNDLDHDMKAGLTDCRSRDLVTSHRAFGYLAVRYGLRQVGISGLSPEEEPSARSLARVSDFVRANHVATIYSEALVSPAVAKTVARESGAITKVLDPLEGMGPRSKGSDYLEVMRSNLATLRAGQDCS